MQGIGHILPILTKMELVAQLLLVVTLNLTGIKPLLPVMKNTDGSAEKKWAEADIITAMHILFMHISATIHTNTKRSS
jgi:hypothetical protein